jgi:hypothetical protein
MAGKEPRLLAELMRAGPGALGRLADSAQQRCDLAGLLRAALPADSAAALLGVNLREDGTLVLTASSPAWASRLRFESGQLLARAQERLPEARRVRVRVLPGEGCGG